jgi:hypothetical protein
MWSAETACSEVYLHSAINGVSIGAAVSMQPTDMKIDGHCRLFEEMTVDI